MDCGFPRLFLSFLFFLFIVSDGVYREARSSRPAFSLAMYASIVETIS